MMNNNFDRIEAHLRALFEENLPKIFTGYQSNRTLVDELIDFMRNNMQKDKAGISLAPDLFIINVPPIDLIEWQVHQDVLDGIAVSIHQTGVREGILFQKPPKIVLHPEPGINQSNFTISAHFSAKIPDLPDTAAMTQADSKTKEDIVPENALLIIGAQTNFLLNKPLINIGRHSSNDLVLDDLHVSRHHAQLRAIKDHYVIFDVGSTGGLYLNGKRITQATLHAGDVIRIGMVNLIYNQDPTNAYPTSAMPIENDDYLGDNDR